MAGKVGTGTVRIRLKNGKFRTLGANEAIPLGSEIDATKGRVRLTSASGPGGATQTADFYQGAFLVTQTRGQQADHPARAVGEAELRQEEHEGSGVGEEEEGAPAVG